MSSVVYLHLPASGAAAVSPAFASVWDEVGEAVRLPASQAGGATVGTLSASQPADISPPVYVLIAQFVGPALLAGSLGQSSTASVAVVRAKKTGTDPHESWYAQMVTRLVNSVGTVKAELTGLQHPPATTGQDLNTTLRNRRVSAAKRSGIWPVTVDAGDRLVWEIGFSVGKNAGHTGDPAGGGDVEIEFADSYGVWLPDNTTNTEPGDPWVRFTSAGVLFAAAGLGRSTATYTRPLVPTRVASRLTSPSVAPAVEGAFLGAVRGNRGRFNG